MKKLNFLFFILWLSFAGHSQLNNSWIDYSKTYYKFRLAKDTLCRIYQPALSSLGLGSVNANHFQLWRNGKQVRLFTSVSNAPLGTNDYLEFWGEMNDGLPDNSLYANSDYQLNPKYSLETDTVVYFLTVNTSGGNLRYAAAFNGSSGSLSPEPYFFRNAEFYYRRWLNRGFANVIGEYLYSSCYDAGEGFTTPDYSPSVDMVQGVLGLNVYSAGPSNGVGIKATVYGNAANNRNVKLRIGNTYVYDAPLTGYNYQRIAVNNLPLSLLLSSNNINLAVKDSSAISTDRLVVASIGLTYPARFNFNNQNVFRFDLDSSATGNYLLIENFNYGTQPPVLYDLTESRRYTGDLTAVPGKIKFVLPPSSIPERNFILMSQETVAVNNVRGLLPVGFRNLSLPANRADYLIISNRRLFDDGNGNNYVEQYRQYRSSGAGGAYNAKIFDIDELTDQFAFGITNHPAAVRDFVRYAEATFTPAPQFLFIIGRGVNYREIRNNQSNPLMEKLNMVPTFGWPPSDILLTSAPGAAVPLIPVGRLAAITPVEVKAYLDKVKDYEQAEQTPSPLISEKAWMKNFLHVVGGKDSLESAAFGQYMAAYGRFAADTLLGASVNTFTKTSAAVVQQASGQRIGELFRAGLGFIGYFGHSSANTFEFNLSNPEAYDNEGKYPFFNVSGCNAGNFYVFDSLRFSGNLTISEKYVLAQQRGSIGFLADTHFGIPPFLNYFNSQLYRLFSGPMYGQPLGRIIRRVDSLLDGNNPLLDFYPRIHLEQINLHGDPAIHLNAPTRPDYAIEDPLVRISPNIISLADNSFSLKVQFMNIGKAINDSVFITVKRKLPNDSVKVLFSGKRAPVYFADSLAFQVPINPLTDKGLNQILVDIDPSNAIPELYEINNSLVKEFYIFEDELRPVYPYNYSIINNQNVTFSASTANPVCISRQYVMELDTTELFNSPFKKSYSKSGPCGLVEFTPSNITFADSTVYYWRVAMLPTGSSNFYWNSSSFIYLSAGSGGFNQSHYYQHLKSDYSNISLDNDRKFRYRIQPRQLIIRTGLYPYYGYDKINVNLDFNQEEFYGCGYSRMQFYVFDSTTLRLWQNHNVNSSDGLYGSNFVCPPSGSPNDTDRAFFEYNYSDSVKRKKAMDFIDAIPSGMYVAITNLGRQFSNTSFINSWKRDTLILGSGNSLYHKLKSIGFTKIDSFYRNIPFLYFFKKGSASFTPIQVVGLGDSSYIDQTIALNSVNTDGSITSPAFGPARRWNALHWRGFSVDPQASADSTSIDVLGVRNDGAEVFLRKVNPSRDTGLSFINAVTYPQLRLRMNNSDYRYVTPQQLQYLRINADYLPEGAVAPNVLFNFSDTVDQGQPLDVALAFKNVSTASFDTNMRFRFIVTDRNNVPREYQIPRGKVLTAGGTLILHYSIPTRDLSGLNTLFIEFNPDEDQPEMFHYNNVVFREFLVRQDNYNPLIDVTFDGVHIMNRDIVSAQPKVLIKLKDESRFLALTDTSVLKLQLRYPDEVNPRDYLPDGDTLRFIPADLSTNENTATLEFNPAFPRDGEYELIVSGKDMTGNDAGDLSYRVTFNVINKPMISHLLNYPNPFTSSTAFVFTVTGHEVPQNIRIQILTITGKVVREITSAELGPIHIGNNITEFKWDGTDMYGQKLANGVYLYRVLTNLNGNKLDLFDGRNANGDVINDGVSGLDQYFNKGYGKMYLMR